MKIIQLIIYVLFSLNSVQASEQEFMDLWEQVKQNNEELKSVESLKTLKKLELERAKRHWAPRVMIGAHNFTTNDPGKVLFGNLGQGAVEQTDFAPANINNPGQESFTQASLMIDLPFYEGGRRQAMVEMESKLYEAEETNVLVTETELYASLINDYSRLNSNQQNAKLLEQQAKEISILVKNYKIGSKQSPVGYSGLLGFKGVLNKIKAYQNAIMAESKFHQEILNFKAAGQVKTTYSGDLLTLLNRIGEGKKQSASSKLKLYQLRVESLDAYEDLEKSRFIPKVGVFSSSDYYQGDRDENQVQTIGVYIKWDLFNNESYGKLAEAKQRLKATRQHYESAKRKERSYRKVIRSNLQRLKENLRLTEESLEILNEQEKVSLRLYKRGQINGIQMAQIFNSKVDLIAQKMQVEKKIIEAVSKNYKLNN